MASRFPHDLPLPGPKNDLKPTPGKTKVPTRTVLPSPPKRRVSLNPNQQANLNVNRMLQPQYNQAATEAQRQNQAIQAFTTAAMQQLGLIPGQIQSDYQHAADTQAGLVNAAADSLKAANPNADIQSLLSAIGAPGAQSQQVASQLGNAFTGAAGVGQYADSLPLAALQEHGLAATELARLAPGNLALAGRQSLLSALQSQGDTRAKIAAQYPSLYQDQLKTFSSNAAKRQQLALEYQTLGLKQQNQTFNQNAKTASLQLQQDKFIAQQQKTLKDGTRIDASASRAAGYVIDKNGNPILKNGKRQILPGFNTNAQGRVVKSKKLTAAQTKAQAQAFPNLTKTQVQHLRAGIANAFYGFTDKKGVKHPAVSYQEAITEGVKAGYSRAAAIRMANRFFAPGKRGRPGAVAKANARARKGKDATGLGIIVPPING